VEFNGASYLATNQQVLFADTIVSIKTLNGVVIKPNLTKFILHKSKDILLMNYSYEKESGFTPINLKISGSIEEGEFCMSYGLFMDGRSISKDSGTILSQHLDKIELSNKITKENSSGPVVNKKGEIVGIVSFVTRSPLNWSNINLDDSQNIVSVYKFDDIFSQFWIENNDGQFLIQANNINDIYVMNYALIYQILNHDNLALSDLKNGMTFRNKSFQDYTLSTLAEFKNKMDHANNGQPESANERLAVFISKTNKGILANCNLIKKKDYWITNYMKDYIQDQNLLATEDQVISLTARLAKSEQITIAPVEPVKPVVVERKSTTCSICKGSGKAFRGSRIACPTCGGTGQVWR